MFEEIDQKKAIELTKIEADKLGVKYSPNIGLETLRERIDNHKLDNSGLDTDFIKKAKEASVLLGGLNQNKIMSDNLDPLKYKQKIMAKASKLIRCSVTCVDPSKKDIPGAIMGVRNSMIPLTKKFVPYDGTVTHLPEILFNHLKEKTCQIFRIEINKSNGEKIRKSKTEKMFAVHKLPPLTDDQLTELAETQKANAS